MWHRVATTVAVVVAIAAGGSAAAASAKSQTISSTSTQSWTVYHGAPDGNGAATSVASVGLASPAWTSPALDGQLYGEPLVSGERIYVATENDTVDALSASTGAVVWSTHVGTPVPAASLPCGDISPSVGITGTPVIDEARGELFVVADELVNGSPTHLLVGLSLDAGTIELHQDVDPAGSTAAALLQRTGLTLDAGRVVFGFGGNFGDCSTYHGWVMSVPESGGTPASFSVDSAPGERQGAVWMGGAAPTVDANGNAWVTAGNGSVTSPSHAYDDSDSVLELSPAMKLQQYFAPSSWASDNARDLDMSTGVALLGNGQVVAASKSRRVFLLNGSSLGRIGGQQAQLGNACGDDIDGGAAVVGTTVYLPCQSGPIAVQVSASPASLHLLWSSSAGGGPPIVAAGLVWTMDSDGVLYGLNPSTGAVQERAMIGAPANPFPTPSVGAGLLLASAATRVVAFKATSSTTPTSTPTTVVTATTGRTTTTTSTAMATTTGSPASSNPWVIAAAVAGGLVVLGGGAWLLWRRRRPPGGR